MCEIQSTQWPRIMKSCLVAHRSLSCFVKRIIYINIVARVKTCNRYYSKFPQNNYSINIMQVKFTSAANKCMCEWLLRCLFTLSYRYKFTDLDANIQIQIFYLLNLQRNNTKANLNFISFIHENLISFPKQNTLNTLLNDTCGFLVL